VTELEARFLSHEAVCAERWKETILRIKRMEHILLGVAGAIIMLLLSLVLKVH
jgi:hypothetical protein